LSIDFSKYPLPKRFRHHTAANLYMPASTFKVKPNYYPPIYDKLNWKEVFINGKPPVLIDIGCGKGTFLLTYAMNNPEQNILGIEIRKQPVEWISLVISGEKIQNCGVLWYSMANGLDFIETNSIDKLFYLFPDPWPKRKHVKRRVFNEESIVEYARVLKKEGELYIATDLEEIHSYHLKILDKSDLFKYKIIENDVEWNLPVTNKEKFCRTNDIKFFRIKCLKR
jgi:tRNA (guanine-N7-)-methyltransferase